MDPYTGKDKECDEGPSEPCVIVSDKAMRRVIDKSAALPEDTEPPACFPLPPQRQCLIENFMESGGINSILEDAIEYYAAVVEKRAAAIVRLQTLCNPERDSLQACFVANQHCSHRCSLEVEAFTACINKGAPSVVDGKVKAHVIDKEKAKRAKEISHKYNF